MTEMTAYQREWRAKGYQGDVYEPKLAPIPAQRPKLRSDAAFYFDEAVRLRQSVDELGAKVERMRETATRAMSERDHANERAEQQNAQGGEARMVVMDIAHLLGVDLTDQPKQGSIWGVENMQRVVDHVKAMRLENANLKGKLAVIREAATVAPQLRSEFATRPADRYTYT